MPASLARLVAASAVLLAISVYTSATVDAVTTGLPLPAPAGTQWEVLAGYNTATHVDVDPYALDIWRPDGLTAGTPVLSPIAGSVGYVSDTCVSVRTSDLSILMCHVFADPGLARGQSVIVGQRLAVVAPDGAAGNNGIAHIHYQLNRPGQYGYGSGDPVAFAGEYALEGQSLPAVSTYNAYYGTRFVSTNDASAAVAYVDAGLDRVVGAGEMVSLVATGKNVQQFQWLQYEGPPVGLQVSGATASFVAPVAVGTVLGFQVTGAGPFGEAADTVRVTVGGALDLPDGGLGLVVWQGGALNAVELQQQGVRSVWAFVAGKPIGYVVGAPDFVNATFLGYYPALTFSGETILLVAAIPG